MNEPTFNESEFSRLLSDLPRADASRDEHRERLRRLALEEFDRASASTADEPAALSAVATSRWRRIIHQGRRIMTRPLPRIMAAAVILVLAGWLFLPGTQSTASAFNEVVDKFMSAKSARFIMEVKSEAMPTTQTFRAEFLAPNRIRQEVFNVTNIADYNQGKVLTLMPATKEAILMTIKNRPKDAKPENMFDHVRKILSERRKDESPDIVSLGEKEIDGKKVEGFRNKNGDTLLDVWGDPMTGWPVRIETTWNGTPKTETVFKSFEFNVPVDESRFSLEIPVGYTQRTVELDASPATEADLIAAFQMAYDMKSPLPSSIDAMGVAMFVAKLTAEEMVKLGNDTQTAMQYGLKIGRGFQFAHQLPAAADAHYAGKGVTKDETDRPIFWYKPEGKSTYRVIYGDLSVREVEKAPEVKDAVKVGGTTKLGI
jgi:outer membrane lipoprotein-sorting protein